MSTSAQWVTFEQAHQAMIEDLKRLVAEEERQRHTRLYQLLKPVLEDWE